MTRGVVIDGSARPLPEHECVSWLDDPKAFPPAPKVYRGRKSRPQMVVVHATVGNLGPLWPDAGPAGGGARYASYLATTTRAVSWDFTIERGGRIVQHNDPARNATWQATHVNGLSLGIELEQEPDGTTYAPQYPALVALVGSLCDAFEIPRVVSARDGAACLKLVPALTAKRDGWKTARGVVYHCNLTDSRGPGDPGPHAGAALLAAGFAPHDFAVTS